MPFESARIHSISNCVKVGVCWSAFPGPTESGALGKDSNAVLCLRPFLLLGDASKAEREICWRAQEFVSFHGFGRPLRLRTRSAPSRQRSEEHTSELQSHVNLVCRLLLEKKNKK